MAQGANQLGNSLGEDESNEKNQKDIGEHLKKFRD
jgi:hypothetical protein